MIWLEDPETKVTNLYFPGGMVEKNETPLVAAERETLEETGYLTSAHPQSEYITSYTFRWGGEDYDCDTYWYTGTLRDEKPAPVNDAAYHRGVCWVPLGKVREKIAFHSAIQGAFDHMRGQPGFAQS